MRIDSIINFITFIPRSIAQGVSSVTHRVGSAVASSFPTLETFQSLKSTVYQLFDRRSEELRELEQALDTFIEEHPFAKFSILEAGELLFCPRTSEEFMALSEIEKTRYFELTIKAYKKLGKNLNLPCTWADLHHLISCMNDENEIEKAICGKAYLLNEIERCRGSDQGSNSFISRISSLFSDTMTSVKELFWDHEEEKNALIRDMNRHLEDNPDAEFDELIMFQFLILPQQKEESLLIDSESTQTLTFLKEKLGAFGGNKLMSDEDCFLLKEALLKDNSWLLARARYMHLMNQLDQLES
jgi:hypothetical protein